MKSKCLPCRLDADEVGDDAVLAGRSIGFGGEAGISGEDGTSGEDGMSDRSSLFTRPLFAILAISKGTPEL